MADASPESEGELVKSSRDPPDNQCFPISGSVEHPGRTTDSDRDDIHPEIAALHKEDVSFDMQT